MTDSFFDPDYSEIEFHKINDQLLEIALYQKDVPSKLGIYDLDLNLLQSIPLSTACERQIRCAIDQDQNLYQISNHNKINIADASSQGLIPVLRKVKLQKEFTPEMNNLSIVDVRVQNPMSYEYCFDFKDHFCSYSFENLYYEFTLESNSKETITSFGHYVGAVLPSICGYFYQDYRYYDGFALEAGQQITFSDSILLGWVAEAPKLNFYVVGANHCFLPMKSLFLRSTIFQPPFFKPILRNHYHFILIRFLIL